MTPGTDTRLLRLEEKISYLERLCDQLNQATQNQEIRLEKMQNILHTNTGPKEPEGQIEIR